jgi:two-component system KDP operon response regulator KdpE
LKPTILVVEDEPAMRRVLRTGLGAYGYRVVESPSGRRGEIDAGSHKPDAAIVDLGLPDIEGIDVIRHVRVWSSMPIIVLSARAQERAKIEALDAGADDYVVKPFGMGELCARIRASMRDRIRGASIGPVIRFGRAALDTAARVVTRDGVRVPLTPTEFRLLAILAKQSGRIVTHRQLLAEVWGPTHVEDTHYLRLYVKQLRDKLEDDPVRPVHLVTELGIGYRLAPDDARERGPATQP